MWRLFHQVRFATHSAYFLPAEFQLLSTATGGKKRKKSVPLLHEQVKSVLRLRGLRFLLPVVRVMRLAMKLEIVRTIDCAGMLYYAAWCCEMVSDGAGAMKELRFHILSLPREYRNCVAISERPERRTHSTDCSRSSTAPLHKGRYLRQSADTRYALRVDPKSN